MATGQVKWFDAEKGFGFIAPDDGTPDRFVHRSALVGAFELADADRVSFDSESSPRGPVAVNVSVIERSGLPPRPRRESRDFGSYGEPPRSGGRFFVSDFDVDNAPVVRGTVTRFDYDRGFGFIKPESGDDVFVHQSAAGESSLRPGDRVEFRIVSGPKGPRAERVERVS